MEAANLSACVLISQDLTQATMRGSELDSNCHCNLSQRPKKDSGPYTEFVRRHAVSFLPGLIVRWSESCVKLVASSSLDMVQMCPHCSGIYFPLAGSYTKFQGLNYRRSHCSFQFHIPSDHCPTILKLSTSRKGRNLKKIFR